MSMNSKEMQTIYYYGRIFQFYLDNSQEFESDLVPELGFLIPVINNSENNPDFSKLKKLLTSSISKEAGFSVEIVTKTLPSRRGKRVIIKKGKKRND